MGGLSKKSYQIKAILKDTAKPVLVLDAGNLLFKQTTVAEHQELITATGIIEIYKRMAYDAVAVGPHDLAAGLDFVQEAQANDFPWISANIVTAHMKPLFKPSKIIQRAGLSIGIIGLTQLGAQFPSGIKIIDWRVALAEELSILKKSCDLIVILTSLSDADNAELMQKFPEVHILLSANRSQGNILPRIIGNTLYSQTQSQGKYIGLLDLDWHPRRLWAIDFNQQNLIQHERLSVVDRQIARVERLNNLPETAVAQLQTYRQERIEILKKIEELKITEAVAGQQGKSFNSYKSTFIALKSELPDDPEIAERVGQIKEQINFKNQESLTNNQSHKQAYAGDAQKMPKGFTGSNRCSTCHASQAAFWKTTEHARAYHTLSQQRQNYNLDCLPCHVTIRTQHSLKSSEVKQNLAVLPLELRGVGCESCHGPGYDHAGNPEQTKPKRIVEESTCRSCHTETQSPGFSFSAKIPLVRCPSN